MTMLLAHSIKSLLRKLKNKRNLHIDRKFEAVFSLASLIVCLALIFMFYLFINDPTEGNFYYH
jgi:lipopolysaccharide/colanic/teichoic acid biosynthesis glycosyltransferase